MSPIESEQAKGDEAMTTTELETGAKCLMEVKFTGKTEHGDMELVAKWVNGHEYILYASPATVHPASLLDDLRATLETERKVSHGLCAEMKVKDDAIDELRAKLAAAKAENKRNDAEINTLANERNNIHTRSLKLEQERDSARRELGEAIEWMLEDRAANPEYWGRTGALQAHIDAGRAILARHSQPNFKIQAYDEKGNLVLHEREESKPQSEAVSATDYKDIAETLASELDDAIDRCKSEIARAEAAEAECERLREVVKKVGGDATVFSAQRNSATTRAEQAEAKLEKVRDIAQTCRDLSLFGVAKPLDAILDTPPTQQASGCHDVNDLYFPEQQTKSEWLDPHDSASLADCIYQLQERFDEAQKGGA